MYTGATYLGNNTCRFTVWAPEKKSMVLHLLDPDRKIEMHRDEQGYFTISLQDVRPGRHYLLMPDGTADFPDPASHYQPKGVHGPSAIVDHRHFSWHDGMWCGVALEDAILYEIHVGTFTPEGTFEAIIPRLDDLKETGINAIELMPVSQFPGSRNWGYDGVYPYAVQHSYGGPEGLRRLVDACHQKGIAVFLDVVYNHLGPEGNYFSAFAPYFTDQYKTPWGEALNFDGSWSDGVRDYFSNNALFWFEHYHIDGLRVDAIHMVFDNGALHFWEMLSNKVKQLQNHLGRPLHIIAESDLNSPKVVRTPDLGGFGFSAQWLDDFHHALYVLLDKEGKKRYEDFGSLEQLAKAYTDGFVHSGEYVRFRKRKHGVSSAGIPGNRFVVFNQNHDQAGNRAKGERLCMLVNAARLKIAAAALMMAPYVPMLFMGEEYADETPFFYFVSHSDADLIRAVQEGRKREFAEYKWTEEPPDPQHENTFQQSKLRWEKRSSGKHLDILTWHRQLIGLRREHAAFRNFNKNNIQVYVYGQQVLVIHRTDEQQQHHALCVLNFSEESVTFPVPGKKMTWKKILDSTDRMPERMYAEKHVAATPLSVGIYLAV